MTFFIFFCSQNQSTSMKKVNWNVIPPRIMSKDCVWKNGQNVTILPKVSTKLTDEFSTPPARKLSKALSVKPSVKVIEQQKAQNLLIMLRVQHKDTSQFIKKYILNCDESKLSADFIEGLIKCLPNPYEMKQLQKLKEENCKLSDAEDFLSSLCDIDDLIPRLKCIKFKIDFHDVVIPLKHQIEIASLACHEIMASEKFANILKLVLAIGNSMNSGSSLGKAVGFDLSVLPNLQSIKAKNRNRSLLHLVVETVEKDFNELLKFGEDMPHVFEATSVNVTEINDIMSKLAESFKILKSQLEKVKRMEKERMLPEDKFDVAMSSFFLNATTIWNYCKTRSLR